MNNQIDVDICYDNTCYICDGTGIDHNDPISERYDKNYIGVCETCGGSGKIQKHNSVIKRKITFKCNCGYKEYIDEEGLGFCPMCK